VVSLLALAGAAFLITAGGLQACSAPQVPPDFGTVPQAAATAHPAGTARATGRSAATGPSSGGTRRSGGGQPAARALGGVAVPPGKVAPVSLTLPGRAPAPVIPEGTTGTRLNLPASVGTLGWWAFGAGLEAPAGSIVIAGHIDAASQGYGYLAALRDSQVGQRVVVRGTDGSVRTFSIAGRRTYRKADGLPESVFSQSVQSRLVLITCTGRFDPAAGRYEDNLVVYAVPVG
jgi:hypothetical protein